MASSIKVGMCRTRTVVQRGSDALSVPHASSTLLRKRRVPSERVDRAAVGIERAQAI
jgi:hypothetical protein